LGTLRGWLLDTNVVSELRKPRPDLRVRGFVAAQPAHLLFLSTITLAEVRYGVERLTDAARRRDITLWLERTWKPLVRGTSRTGLTSRQRGILPSDFAGSVATAVFPLSSTLAICRGG